jgi:hypothetical protein
VNCRRSGITLGLMVVAAALFASCSSTSPSSGKASPRSTVAVPHGWKTYRYGKARISVPADWAVLTNYLCASSTSVGTLYLGPPKGPPYASCPSDVGQGDSVTITPLSPGTADQSQCSFKMNGLRVHYGPRTSSNAAGVVFYDIPTLGIRAEGIGSGNQNVTGPGTGTVVGQVLHTIRPSGEPRHLVRAASHEH